MKQIEIAANLLTKFNALVLGAGSHKRRAQGMCAMEAAAWLAGEKHSDEPSCVSPVIRAFMVRWNDDLDDEGRQKLKPLIPRVLNTAGDGKDEMRGWLAADWLVRVHTPAWLELAGITESATALRALPPLRSLASLKTARPLINEAREKSDAARAAAWAAARAAAGAAAGAAARAAAGDAARAAAGAAAWAAARAAAGDAAWDAAWAAAGDAAGAAAKQKLEPTKIALQSSALELLEQMIDPQ